MPKEVIFFQKPSEFRDWLDQHHQTETEIYVGYYKIKSGKKGITWEESVDEAICYGWIDGIRRSIDEESYCNRFTPRRPTSNWSAVNIRKVEELTLQGRMKEAGLLAFAKRKENKSEVYSYENKPEKLDSALKTSFQENSAAWEFFNLQAQSYQKTMFYWIMSAKQEATRLNRLNKLIGACKKGERLR